MEYPSHLVSIFVGEVSHSAHLCLCWWSVSHSAHLCLCWVRCVSSHVLIWCWRSLQPHECVSVMKSRDIPRTHYPWMPSQHTLSHLPSGLIGYQGVYVLPIPRCSWCPLPGHCPRVSGEHRFILLIEPDKLYACEEARCMPRPAAAEPSLVPHRQLFPARPGLPLLCILPGSRISVVSEIVHQAMQLVTLAMRSALLSFSVSALFPQCLSLEFGGELRLADGYCSWQALAWHPIPLLFFHIFAKNVSSF